MNLILERWKQHWITPLAFVPFGLMPLVHRLLGLSDEMLAPPTPGQPSSLLYNVALVLAFQLGVAGYLAHTFWMFQRGWRWVVLKCIALAIAWAAMIWFLRD